MVLPCTQPLAETEALLLVVDRAGDEVGVESRLLKTVKSGGGRTALQRSQRSRARATLRGTLRQSVQQTPYFFRRMAQALQKGLPKQSLRHKGVSVAAQATQM